MVQEGNTEFFHAEISRLPMLSGRRTSGTGSSLLTPKRKAKRVKWRRTSHDPIQATNFPDRLEGHLAVAKRHQGELKQ